MYVKAREKPIEPSESGNENERRTMRGEAKERGVMVEKVLKLEKVYSRSWLERERERWFK